ncbi:MAG TPA: hypothetical protein VI321_11485 [Burkholderiales bacterium]
MAALSALAPATSPQARKLRVGLFADTRLQPQWVVESFARIARSECAEIVAICCGDAPPPELPWTWKLYDRLDRAAFRAGRDPLALADLTRLPHHKHLHSGSEADFLALDLDVAFALGRFDDKALEGIAHYGVWRYCFGEQRHEEEALAGVQEVVRGLPVSGSGVKVRIGGSVRLAYQSWSRTYPFSVGRNRAQLLRKTAEFAQRALAELHRSGRDWLEQCKLVVPAPAVAASRERKLAPILGRIAERGLQKALGLEQWFLAYRIRESRFGDARAIAPDLAGFTRLMPPRDRYWADPFVLEKGGRYFVFFEELMFRTGRAHISMLEIDAAGRASAPIKVLQRDYHLSYPFVLEHDGSLYMIPETAQNGTIEAYRCVDFPHSWRLERILVSGVHCVDATFHQGSGRWWMFGNVAAAGATMFDDELHVFHADRLLGEWQPHARNPVKSDTRSARPAGKLYWHNGALYRPAQICAPLYGSGLSINRVMRLTTQDYAERQVERILPAEKAGLLGVHTLNRAGDLTIVDAFTRRRRF